MTNKPIYSESAEKSLVGCIVYGQGAALDAMEILPEHFFHFATRTLAEAAMKLHSGGHPVNANTIIEAIPQDTIAKIGGLPYVLDACMYPAPSQASHFLQILDSKLRLRKAQEIRDWLSTGVNENSNPDEVCEGLRKRMGELETTTHSENILASVIGSIRKTIAEVSEGRVQTGIQMPWDAWNIPFGGLNKAKMYVIAGRPGTGKTAMMEAMIECILTQGHPVLVFEKDMSPETLIERMACRIAQVPHYLLEKGVANKAQLGRISSALDILEDSPLHLYNPTNMTAERMCAITRREVRLRKVKAVFLDHIQVLKVGKDFREGLTQASIAIRDCCTQTAVPHVILAHVNRDAAAKAGGKPTRPRPEDIKEFDQLYGDCDGMALLWSEEKPEDVESGTPLPVNLYAAKNRGGPVAEEYLNFNRPLMHFSDRKKTE